MDIGSLYFRFGGAVHEFFERLTGSMERARDLTTDLFLSLLKRGVYRIPARGAVAERWILQEARLYIASVERDSSRALHARARSGVMSAPSPGAPALGGATRLLMCARQSENANPSSPERVLSLHAAGVSLNSLATFLPESRPVLHRRYRGALRALRGRTTV